MTGIFAIFRHIGWKHRSHPDVLSRMSHLGLVECVLGCGALVIERLAEGHLGRCRGERAAGPKRVQVTSKKQTNKDGPSLVVSTEYHR